MSVAGKRFVEMSPLCICVEFIFMKDLVNAPLLLCTCAGLGDGLVRELGECVCWPRIRAQAELCRLFSDTVTQNWILSYSVFVNLQVS